MRSLQHTELMGVVRLYHVYAHVNPVHCLYHPEVICVHVWGTLQLHNYKCLHQSTFAHGSFVSTYIYIASSPAEQRPRKKPVSARLRTFVEQHYLTHYIASRELLCTTVYSFLTQKDWRQVSSLN